MYAADLTVFVVSGEYTPVKEDVTTAIPSDFDKGGTVYTTFTSLLSQV